MNRRSFLKRAALCSIVSMVPLSVLAETNKPLTPSDCSTLLDEAKAKYREYDNVRMSPDINTGVWAIIGSDKHGAPVLFEEYSEALLRFPKYKNSSYYYIVDKNRRAR